MQLNDELACMQILLRNLSGCKGYHQKENVTVQNIEILAFNV